MSIVEEALKRIHHARGSQPGPDRNTPIGKVVDAPARTARIPNPSGRMVQIDLAKLRAAGLLPAEQQERELADQYRQIKRPLIANALGHGTPRADSANLVLLASALSGEGKTFMSINLALSMALEKDISVILVDADVAKPHVSGIFGIDKEPGLLDALRDETIDVATLVLPTNVPRLSVLPAGRHVETATELLASARMRQIAHQLATSGDNPMVLFDSSPLLLTTESRVLSGITGQVVLVVRASFTPQQAVLDAVALLDEGKNIGVVLNQCDGPTPGGYHYRYGYYGRNATEGEASVTA